MDEKQKLQRKLRVIMVIMVAAVLPGLIRMFDSPAFDSIRSVDAVTLFFAGVGTGGFVAAAIRYVNLRNKG